MKILNRIFRISPNIITEVNRYIFNLPIENVSPKEEIYNKHLQNLVWVFWFGKVLHKE